MKATPSLVIPEPLPASSVAEPGIGVAAIAQQQTDSGFGPMARSGMTRKKPESD
jgi:hypothetical protein